MPTTLSDERKQELKEKTDDVFVRVIGFVSFLIGIIAVTFACLLGYRIFDANFNSVVVVFIGAVFLFSAFFLNVGWRMLFNKPNRYGSILSPQSWIVIGLLFVAGFVFLALSSDKISADSPDFVNTVIGLVSCLGLSVCCFYLAYLAYKKG